MKESEEWRKMRSNIPSYLLLLSMSQHLLWFLSLKTKQLVLNKTTIHKYDSVNFEIEQENIHLILMQILIDDYFYELNKINENNSAEILTSETKKLWILVF